MAPADVDGGRHERRESPVRVDIGRKHRHLHGYVGLKTGDVVKKQFAGTAIFLAKDIASLRVIDALLRLKDEGEAELPIADWDRGKSVELAGGTVAARTAVSMCGTDPFPAYKKAALCGCRPGALTRRKLTRP